MIGYIFFSFFYLSTKNIQDQASCISFFAIPLTDGFLMLCELLIRRGFLEYGFLIVFRHFALKSPLHHFSTAPLLIDMQNVIFYCSNKQLVSLNSFLLQFFVQFLRNISGIEIQVSWNVKSKSLSLLKKIWYLVSISCNWSQIFQYY